jgi:AAA+ superfamily predicted ATPase
MSVATYNKLFKSSKRPTDDDEIDLEDEGESERIFANSMVENADALWRKNFGVSFTFLVTRRSRKMILGVVTLKNSGTRRKDIQDGLMSAELLAGEFLKSAKIGFSDIRVEETTLQNVASMIRGSYHNDYLTDDDDTFKLLGLRGVALQPRRMGFKEYLARDISECRMSADELVKKAGELLCAGTMLPEIERIYQGVKRPVTAGHPVHYVIMSDSDEIRRGMINILFASLRANGRVQNGRYGIVRCDERGSDGKIDYAPLHHINSGGMMVIEYVKDKGGDDGDLATPCQSNIDEICEAVKKYKNEVLTVLCLPTSSGEVMDLFMERLNGMMFLPLKEEPLFGGAAKKYLRAAAERVGVRPDKSLYSITSDPEKGLSAADLDLEFDRWFNRALKSQIYPQYGKLAHDAFVTFKKKPKGSAYSELDSLIGLAGAKEIIKKAVNYHKAQAMFRSRGMKTDNAAMHMVFTGNPGSAKTTVARLFARIMKENGLLSRGNLIEVGRSDLVGKYVGWTAPIVKKKFSEAKGSVLFIDEAYSLVDDRAGSYGDEAISAIVQEMENNRSDMAVIFAGYPDKMEGFFSTNPGLRSRIAFHVRFDDYSPDELFDILAYMARGMEVRLAEDVREKAMSIFNLAVRGKDYGNGRFVRNIFERARMNQADRLLSIGNVTECDIRTLLAEDFQAPQDLNSSLNPIGFAV